MLRKKSLFSCENLQLSLFRSNFQEKLRKKEHKWYSLKATSIIHISSQNFEVKNGPKPHFPPQLIISMYKFSFGGIPFHSTYSKKTIKMTVFEIAVI